MSSAAAVSQPDVSFPVDPAPSQNHHQTAWRASSKPDPQPLRMGRAGTALLAPKLPPASCGNPVAPSGLPRSAVPVPASAPAREGGAADLPEGSGRGHSAPRVFKLSCFRERPRCLSFSLFLNLLPSSAPKTTSSLPER